MYSREAGRDTDTTLEGLSHQSRGETLISEHSLARICTNDSRVGIDVSSSLLHDNLHSSIGILLHFYCRKISTATGKDRTQHDRIANEDLEPRIAGYDGGMGGVNDGNYPTDLHGRPQLPPQRPGPQVKRLRTSPPPSWDAEVVEHSPLMPIAPLGTAFPFAGDIRGALWNTQALLCAKVHRQRCKQGYVRRLCTNRDVVGLTEVHGDAGSVKGYLLPPGFRGYWALGSSTQGGVGLLISEAFLQQFDESFTSWDILVPGRAAVLRLGGRHGRLDLFVNYFATGVNHEIGNIADRSEVKQQRAHMRRILEQQVHPREQVWTLMMGDHNWVTQREDRICKATAEYTGLKDRAEQEDWSQRMESGRGLSELQQPEMTCETASARSRIDRIYSSHHVAEQQDREWRAGALEWVPHLSAHRAVHFAKLAPAARPSQMKPLNKRIVQKEGWDSRVLHMFHHLLAQDPRSDHPFRQLALIKKAMKVVTEHMEAEAAPGEITDDELSIAMRALRAAEQDRFHSVARWLAALPECYGQAEVQRLRNQSAGSIAERMGQDGGKCGLLQELREIIKEAAKKSIIQDLEDLRDDRKAKDLQEDELRRRRLAIGRKLVKLQPGGQAAIRGIMDTSGLVQTDPGEMARALREHWEPIFTRRQTDRSILRRWAQEQHGRQDFRSGRDPAEWDIHPHHVKRAIELAPNSATGVDGIPFAAWRRIKDEASIILSGVIEHLTKDGAWAEMDDLYGQEWGSYNLSWLIFIPKGDPEQDDEHGCYHQAKNTRPISVVNCDNRLVAGAARLAWEEMLGREIHECQRGFLRGRSMLANVLDVEENSLLLAAEGDGHATIYFDFRAAFPSMSHDFLEDAMRYRGIPDKWARLLRHLYMDNGCLIPLGGQTHGGFRLTAGIRQGCPLSPLIFSAAMDYFLRRLAHQYGDGKVRAFADDTAISVRDFLTILPGLASEFRDLELASGLGLNIDKTVVSPLHRVDLPQLRELIERTSPDWAGVTCSYTAKYLGFWMGPGREELQWRKVEEKMLRRARSWAAAGLGAFFTSEAYRIYIASIAGFLGQLAPIPSTWRRVEQDLLQILFPGPRRWLPAAVAHHLSQLGFRRDLVDVTYTAWAAKLRVERYENRRQGGLCVRRRAEHLEEAWRRSEELTTVTWKSWLEGAFLLQLRRAREQAETKGVTKDKILQTILRHGDGPRSAEETDRCRRQYQRTARLLLEKAAGGSPDETLRRRLRRWHTGIWPRLLAPRLRVGLQLVGTHGAPRLAATLLRANLNGWVTSRRFQRAGGCGLGCSADDSLEHYARCPKIWHIASGRLRVRRPGTAFGDTCLFLGLEKNISVEVRLKMALLVYGVYKFLNYRRHRRISVEDGPSYIWQSMKNGARGHPYTERLLDCAWAV